MPTYRSIALSLVSQFDLQPIPEYSLPSNSPSPSTKSNDIGNKTHDDTGKKVYSLTGDGADSVNVYTPVLLNSQFWLNIRAAKPVFPTEYYFFKFFVDGKHFSSWGIGEESDWSGKMVFGLFVNGYDQIERRNLAFGPVDVNGVIEVKVYRCFSRKRIKPQLERLVEDTYEWRRKPTTHGGNHAEKAQDQFVGLLKRREQDMLGIRFTHGGILKAQHRHRLRYYKYELIDLITRPFATFRYLFRSCDQLNTLCAIDHLDSEHTESALDPYSSYSDSSEDKDLGNPTLEHRDACFGETISKSALDGRLSRLSLRNKNEPLPSVFPPPYALLPPPKALIPTLFQSRLHNPPSPSPASSKEHKTLHSTKYSPQQTPPVSPSPIVPPRGRERLIFLRDVVTVAGVRIGGHRTSRVQL
ncbi:MAG: hypothetical protein M1813_004272 [Trichoglossum hirsutum]|nr:MAG: hypothetical protein M1813_004272 [Trichoglossum hirsutum]